MVERYAHLAPDHLAQAANRLDPLLEGYDFATLENDKGSATTLTPCDDWWPRAELNHRHTDFQSAALPTELLGQAFDFTRVASAAAR
jgi:hypothetical protein